MAKQQTLFEQTDCADATTNQQPKPDAEAKTNYSAKSVGRRIKAPKPHIF